MKVAILHDYLNQSGGAEKCLEAFMDLFPKANLFTLFYDPNGYDLDPSWKVNTSFIQYLSKLKNYKFYFPLFPLAINLFKLDSYSFLLSSSHSYVKNVRKPKNALHICYCHTPMRYTLHLQEQYLQEESFFLRPFIKLFLKWLAYWDKKNTKNVDFFIANSKNVQQRIRTYYGRSSEVIYPFVDCTKYKISTKKEDFYLIVSRLISAKKIDLAIRAFASLNKKLVIIGTGREQQTLQRSATPNVQFLGYLPEEQVISYYQRARALILPGLEDLGMTPLEAQACGTPVIAYGEGGALETIREGKTGHFFYEQTADSLARAIKEFEQMKFKSENCRKQALTFDLPVFKRKLKTFIEEKYQAFNHVPSTRHN